MAPDPSTGKSRGSRYRSNDGGVERDLQRSEMGGKGKGEKESGGTDSGRGLKRRQYGSGGDGVVGATPVSVSSSHRSSKRWRGDAAEAMDSIVPGDRWDGGASDPTKEISVSAGKSKHESDGKGGDGSVGKVTAASGGKEGPDTEKLIRKQRVSKASLASDSRAITVMDLQGTDISVIDSNIRIKNKVSYRKETITEIMELGLDQGFKENAKSTAEVSRTRRRWDRDLLKGGAEEAEEAHVRGNVGSEGSQEREKRKEKIRGRDRDVDISREQNGRRSEGSRERVTDVGGRLENSDELDQRSNEWKIQEELRNVELEKELENRIRRRREESGDRDRWRDDDRERDGKRHSDTRDERHREDWSRRERERHSDRHESRAHREESRPSEGKQREDRHYESDREYRLYREDRHYGARSKDPEDQGRPDRSKDQEHRDRKGRDKLVGHEVEQRSRDKCYKDEASEREKSYSANAFVEAVDVLRTELQSKRARENDVMEGYGGEGDHSRQGGRPGDVIVSTGNDFAYDDRPRHVREDRDADGRLEYPPRGSPRDHDNLVTKSTGNNWRSEGQTLELLQEGLPSPRHDARASPPSNRMDYASPPRSEDRRSPRYPSQRSLSPPQIDAGSGPSRGKAGHGEWFEPSNSVNSSTGPQRRPTGGGLLAGDRRDRVKWHAGAEEEVKSGMYRGHRGIDDGRECSLSPQRLRDQHLASVSLKPPLHGQDNFPRGTVSRGDRERWRSSTQAGAASIDGGQMDHHGLDDLSPRERNERVRRISMNRPPGSPMVRPQLASLPVPPLAPLPPPPPFRPGIDNPAVLGPPNGGFDDGNCSREQGRVDRKGGPLRRGEGGGGIGPGDAWRGVNMGNWNSRNQGPLPGNAFPLFPPQFAPHPASGGAGFPGMGQQFPGPPIFPGAGGRPPLDMGFGGRFMGPGSHMGESGDGFLGPGRGGGWHGPGEGDDGRGPPLMGPVDGWEGPGPHGDDRHRHGRIDWDRGGPMGVRVWERDRERELWEGRPREGASDFMPLRSQMEAPLQNSAFPPGGTAWGMPREPQVPNEVKPRPERPPFDIQDVKRKTEGVHSKAKAAKPSGRALSGNEVKRNKYATAMMQAVLSQLDISPNLAGQELYDKFCGLLPVTESDKQMHTSDEEDAASDVTDEDLKMQVDSEAEALLSGPRLLPKLLPPLPEGVFESALGLYRNPEHENQLQKSLVGSFILPFDPATIKLPSFKLELNRSHSVPRKDQPVAIGALLLGQQDVDVLDSENGADFMKSEDEAPVGNVPHELEVPEVRGKVGEALEEEFMPLHGEVAEYSDREFDADMEDPLEEESLKESQVVSAFIGVEASVENSVTIEVDEFPIEKEALKHDDTNADVKNLSAEVEDNLHVKEFSDGEDQETCVGVQVYSGENVNSPAESKIASNCANDIRPYQNVLRGEEGLLVEERYSDGVGPEENIPREVEKLLVEERVGDPGDPGEDVLVGEEIVPVEERNDDGVGPDGNILVEEERPPVEEKNGDDGEPDENVLVEEIISVEERDDDDGGSRPDESVLVDKDMMQVDERDGDDEGPDDSILVEGGRTVEERRCDDAGSNENVIDENMLVEEGLEPVEEGEGMQVVVMSEAITEDVVEVHDVPSPGIMKELSPVEEGEDMQVVVMSEAITEDVVGIHDVPSPGIMKELSPVEEGEDMQVVVMSEAITEDVVEVHNVPSPGIMKGLSPEASVVEEIREAAGDIFVVNAEISQTVEVEADKGESFATTNTFEEFKQVEVHVTPVKEVEDTEDQQSKQYSSHVELLNDTQNDLPEEIPSTLVLENDLRMERNGKLKEINERPPVEELPVLEIPETLTRLRKRRASSRLLAQVEAGSQQDGSVGQGSGRGNKGGAKGTTRTSQRRSKRRGSTH